MNIAIILILILSLGLFSQWLAWKFRIPALLFLLIFGILLGPIAYIFIPTYALSPEHLFGRELFYTLVSLSVSIILFEGCMTLKFDKLGTIKTTVRNLISFGLFFTAIATTFLVYFIMDFPFWLSALIGSVSSVSGPTVIVPMLRAVRPNDKLATIIRWEGMLVDPIGALLAIIVYSAVSSLNNLSVLKLIALHIAGVLMLGVISGVIMGYLMSLILRKHLIPDYLKNMFVLTIVLATSVLTEHLVSGSGMLSVTIMGLWMGNAKDTQIEQIIDFKENLSILLISILFILLASNIFIVRLEVLFWPMLMIILLLQFIVRPISVFLCAWGSDLSFREKCLLSWINPRGIVAAAVSALLSIKVMETFPNTSEYAHELTLSVFMIIIGTVSIQSLTAPSFAKLLGVANPEPRGFLIIGANTFARAIAKCLRDHFKITVMLADTSWRDVQTARLEGFKCYYGNPASEHADWHLDLIGIGRMLGLSAQQNINTLSAIKYRKEFGSKCVFMLSEISKHERSDGLPTRYCSKMFQEDLSYTQLAEYMLSEGIIKTTKLTDKFSWESYLEKYSNSKDYQYFIPLFAKDTKGKVHIFTPDHKLIPLFGWEIISLIDNKLS